MSGETRKSAARLSGNLNSTQLWDLGAGRLDILKGKTEGLELFAPLNLDSSMSPINMLGWKHFYGLSAFLDSPCSTDGRVDKWIRRGCSPVV
jgi:hypothetical protein